MWRAPRTLLWPGYGLVFDRVDVTNWIPGMLHALVTNASVFIPELAGAAVLTWLAVVLIRRKSIRAFIKKGRVPGY